ncbi:MAG: nucleotide exchange factor GrpE [bacterium]|nr:nucleotide exchange factor GrpE [bacterium]
MNDYKEKNNMGDAQDDSQTDLQKCEQARDENLNGWKRAKADLINYQKDEVKRLEEMAKFSNWDLIRELVAVLDSFAAMEASGNNDGGDASDLKGLLMIGRQLEDVLKKRGLERIKAEVGQQLDTSLHEAVEEMAANGPPGSIVEEVGRGYVFNGRVVRPARVKINK